MVVETEGGTNGVSAENGKGLNTGTHELAGSLEQWEKLGAFMARAYGRIQSGYTQKTLLKERCGGTRRVRPGKEAVLHTQKRAGTFVGG